MKRIKALNAFQKALLIGMAAMILVFAFVYAKTIARVGYNYRNEILVPEQEGGNTVYSGKFQGKEYVITVTADREMTYRWGEESWGPYTVREDPEAIQTVEDALLKNMRGIEICRGTRVLFRGGVIRQSDSCVLYREDGSMTSGIKTIETDQGQEIHLGKIVGPAEPNYAAVLDMAFGPALTHKGSWAAFFWGTVICVINALDMLFADELFRWHMHFRIENADKAEPTEWEIATRYIAWLLAICLALFVFWFWLK